MEQPILLLGLDGGGSKTHVVVADANGRVLGRGAGGASNYQYVGEARAIAEIDRAIGQAYEEAGAARRPADAACFGFGGADTPEEMAAMQAWIHRHAWARRYLLLNDGLLPLYAACLDGHGAAVVAGTGAIMWAQTRDGRIARASGWGYLFGDEGSGYWLGSETLRHLMRARDGRGPGTALTERVLAHWQLPDTRHLLLRLYGREVLPAEIAELARVALECAGDGDEVALDIARAGASELAQAVEAAMRGVDLRAPAILAYTGSLLVKNALYRELFAEAIRARVGAVDLRGVELPVMGALAAAVQFQSGQLGARNEWHLTGMVEA